MLDHLIFDTTDWDTIDDTHSVGAYVRSGESGALITHHSQPEAGSITFGFVDGDVTVGTDTINETAHGLVTGDVVRLTSSGTLPAGLALLTDYYVIRIDADNFKLASSAKNAERGIAVDITAAAGGGTHTVTEQEVDRRALDVYMVNEIDVNLTQADEVTVFQGTSPWVIGDGGGSITVDATDLDIRDLTHVSDSVKVGDGTDFLAINADGSINITDNGSSITVDATDLDIRDLLHTQDSVRLGDGTSFISSGTGASDNVANTFNGLDARSFMYVYDSVGDNWDRLRSSGGSLFVSDVGNTAIANAANTLDVADTAEATVASILADRKYLWIYNNDNTKIYIGSASVTAANGFPVSPGSYLELRAGAAVSPFFVGQSGKTPEIRTLELS